MNSLCTQHTHMHTVSMCRNTHKAHLSSSSLYTCLLFLIVHKHFSEAASPAATLRLERNVLTAFADGWLNWDGAGNKQLKVPRCRLTFCSFIMKPKKKMKKNYRLCPDVFCSKLKKKERKDFIKNVTQGGFMWCTASLFEFTPDIRPGNNCQLTIKSNIGHPDVCINETVHELLLLFQEVSPA